MSNSSQSSNSSSTSVGPSASTIGTPASPSRRGLIFRIVGVVLFLGLGTFAVSQTLMGPRRDKSDIANAHPHGPNHHEHVALKTPPPKSTVTVKPSKVATSGFKTDFGAPKQPKPPTKSGFQSAPKTDSFKLSPPKSFQVKTEPKGFNPKPKVLPPRVPPALQPKPKLATTGPPRTTPVTISRQVATKPAEIPVASFGGTAPKTSNSNPFAAVPQRGNNFTNDLRGKTGDLATKVANGAQGLARDAGKSLDALVTTPRTQQRNGFGQPPASGGPATPPPSSPFSPRTGGGFQAKSAPPVTQGASLSPNGNLNPLNSNPARQTAPLPPRTPPASDNGFGLARPAPRTSAPLPRPNPIQQPARRSTIPTRQVSSASPIGPAVAGVRTMPTPGEKDLEGTRTPTLSVQRVAPREIQLNTPATFEIIVRNTGRIEANDVRIYDQIPTGTQLLEATPQPTSNDGKGVQWAIGKMAPGQERRIQMKLKPTQPGEIGSVAHVTFATRSSVRTLVTKPELSITHTAPERSLIGDDVKLDIVVTNNGNGPANDVMIQEDIPAQLKYPNGFRRIEYPVGVLAPGQSRKLTLNLRAADVGRLRNIVTVSGAGGLAAQHALNMEIVAPKLVANAEGPRRRFLRRQATHDFTVQNNGTASATNVEMMAKIPPGLRFVSANNQGQFDPGTNAVYWSMTELAAETPAVVSLTTVPVDTGNQNIGFTAVADLKQKVTTEAGLVVEHLVDVFFDIDDVVDHIEVGSETSYQLRVVNQGTKVATNIQLNVDLPPGIRPTAVAGGIEGQVQGQRVAFAPITSLKPGDEIKVAVAATGVAPGEHKIVAQMRTDDRQTNVLKEETTQVYSDR